MPTKAKRDTSLTGFERSRKRFDAAAKGRVRVVTKTSLCPTCGEVATYDHEFAEGGAYHMIGECPKGHKVERYGGSSEG
jgi:hypothetical protein